MPSSPAKLLLADIVRLPRVIPGLAKISIYRNVLRLIDWYQLGDVAGNAPRLIESQRLGDPGIARIGAMIGREVFYGLET
jgi:hypothetical protein